MIISCINVCNRIHPPKDAVLSSRSQTMFNAKCISKPLVDFIEEDSSGKFVGSFKSRDNIELLTISPKIFSDEGNLSVSSSTAAISGGSRESNSIMDYILAMHDEWDSAEKAEFLDWDVISQCNHSVSSITPETVTESATISRKRSRERSAQRGNLTATRVYFPCRASLSIPEEIRSSAQVPASQSDRIIHEVEYTCSIKYCRHKYSVNKCLFL